MNVITNEDAQTHGRNVISFDFRNQEDLVSSLESKEGIEIELYCFIEITHPHLKMKGIFDDETDIQGNDMIIHEFSPNCENSKFYNERSIFNNLKFA